MLKREPDQTTGPDEFQLTMGLDRRFLNGWFLVFLSANPLMADVGEPVPEFALRALDGEIYTPSEFRGKVLVLYLMGYD